MSRQIVVTFETPSCAYVRGYGSRDLLVELRGRSPVWTPLARAWAVQPRTARDLMGLAETRGYRVEVAKEPLTEVEVAQLDEVTPLTDTLW